MHICDCKRPSTMIRPSQLLWGRMRFGHWKRTKGKRWVRSEPFVKCRICKDKIKPPEIYPACLCFLCTFLSDPDIYFCAGISPLWETKKCVHDPDIYFCARHLFLCLPVHPLLGPDRAGHMEAQQSFQFCSHVRPTCTTFCAIFAMLH